MNDGNYLSQDLTLKALRIIFNTVMFLVTQYCTICVMQIWSYSFGEIVSRQVSSTFQYEYDVFCGILQISAIKYTHSNKKKIMEISTNLR